MRFVSALAIILAIWEAVFAFYTLQGSMSSKVKEPEFLTTLQKDYGYNGLLDKIRKNDMKHLNGSVYLDYTGSGLYRTSQIKDVSEMFEKTLFANPHSLSPASSMTTDLVEEARKLVLDFVNADPNEYSVIFTASATSSLKLLGESFPWSNESLYLYTRDNHNSVLGIRRWAKHFYGKFKTVDPEDLEGSGKTIDRSSQGPFNLFAFPAEENFAGKKFDLRLIQKFRTTDFGAKFNKGKWFVLLDAAAYLPTNRLDLKRTPADFVVMSFYKIFGYPNLGALVVRNDALKYLQKRDFSGGTVVIATCGTDYALFQPRGCVKFEDGTVPFLSIVALREGIKKYNELGIENIHKHSWAVTRELYARLARLRHSTTGRPAVKIYGNHMRNDPSKQGAILTVNFLNETGGFVGYNEVMKHASAENINVRVGCFCNPGACINAAGLEDDQVQEYYGKKTSCHDNIDIVNGVPLGAVRISMGAYTNMEDVEAFEAFAKKYFVK